jgi:hypothetical protein
MQEPPFALPAAFSSCPIRSRNCAMSSARPTFSTRPPRFFVVLITLREVIAALGLVSGRYPRISSTIAAGILPAAVYAVAPRAPTQVALAAAGYRIHAILGDQLPVRGDFYPALRNRSFGWQSGQPAAPQRALKGNSPPSITRRTHAACSSSERCGSFHHVLDFSF